MKIGRNLSLAIGILLLTILVSCNSLPDNRSLVNDPPTATAKKTQNTKQMKNQNWVIVTEEHAEEKGLSSWLVESDGYWTPSEDDIFKLEEKLAEYLSQNAYLFNRQPPVWLRLNEYQRQYIGLIRGGEKFIYGNYFCNNLNINWLEELVVVDDGGECYFQIEYDVENRIFIQLLVNGES